jgi:hypothetical protein
MRLKSCDFSMIVLDAVKGIPSQVSGWAGSVQTLVNSVDRSFDTHSIARVSFAVRLYRRVGAEWNKDCGGERTARQGEYSRDGWEDGRRTHGRPT